MSRARRAGPVALPIALVLALATASIVAAARRPDGSSPGGQAVGVAAVVVADVHAADLRGRDGRRVGVGRARGAGERRREPGRPDGARGRVRDVDGLDDHAEGDLGGVDDPRSRPAPADRERGRDPCADRGRDLRVGVRGDGRRGGAPAGRREPDRRGRVGRRDERVRGGNGRAGTARRVEPRAAARRIGRQRDRHERERGRLRRRTADARRTWPRRRRRAAACRARRPSRHPMPTPVAHAHPDPGPDAGPDARFRRRSRPRPDAGPHARPDAGPHARPDPVPTPVPTPTCPRPSRRRRRSTIADARLQPDGATVTVSGVLTTDLGAIDSGRIGFVQDATGGIAVRLAAPASSPFRPGRS